MSNLVEVKVPDIGDFRRCADHRPVRQGRRQHQGGRRHRTLESDKATMDVPSPVAGVVKEVLVSSAPRSVKARC
jgi:glycine cleavage system H lipoate-binding protein